MPPNVDLPLHPWCSDGAIRRLVRCLGGAHGGIGHCQAGHIGRAGWPTWSPDGRIVYSSSVDGNILVMGSDGSNPKQLTSNAGGNLLPRVHRTAITLFFF